MRIKNLLVAAATFFCLAANAQPGALDKSFGHFGIVVSTERSEFENILPLANGQFLLTDAEIKSRTYPNGAVESYAFSKFWRYNANGTLDQTFGTNGKKEFWSSDEVHYYFTSFAVLTDGRIVATETGQVLGGTPNPLNRIWIFNSDGTGGVILAELSVFGYFSVNLNDIAVDKNNRIIVTGHVRPNLSTEKTKTYIARLLQDGSFDETFFNGGFRVLVENSSFNYSGRNVITDANNNIIIAEAGVYGAGSGLYISKFQENGSMDVGFGNVKTNHGFVRSLHTDGNSKIIFIDNNFIKRLNTNGTIDLNFAPGISPRKLVIQPDNKIVAIGGGSVFRVNRYKADGTLDPAFGTNGNVTTDLNLDANPSDIIFRNRRLFLSGFIINSYGYGTIIAYDASDVRMTCPNVASSYSTDAGKCYATITGINAVMSTSTLYANVKHKVEYNGAVIAEGDGGVSGRQFQKGITKVTYTYTDITTQTCSFNITVVDNELPAIICPVGITINNTPGKCYGVLVANQLGKPNSSDNCGTVNTTGPTMPANDQFPIGVTNLTWTVRDESNNTATCTQTVTVIDNEKPTINISAKTANTDPGHCYAVLTLNDLGSPSVSDNCTDGLIVTAPTLPANNQFPKGVTNLTWRVTDASGNTASVVQVVTVTDIEIPKIENISATPEVLTPPNRKMRDVTINYTTSDNCAVAGYTISNITSNELDDGPGAANTSPDWEYVDAHHVKLRAERAATGDGRIYTITIQCTDVSGNVSEKTVDVYVRNTIVVHPNATNSTLVNEKSGIKTTDEIKPVHGLTINVSPNPASNYFNIHVNSSDTKGRIMLQVFDQYGRIVEEKNNVMTGVVIRIGDNYRTGSYIVRIIQGKEHKKIKLIKLAN